MDTPLTLICVPTYNRAGLLRQSLRTIYVQDYAPLEILISDNCSEDETESVCWHFARADPRVRYVRQSRNIGIHANHNFCSVFDVGNYQLTPEEFHRVIAQMKDCRTGSIQHAAHFVVEVLLRLGWTWPLAWVTQHVSFLRWVLRAVN